MHCLTNSNKKRPTLSIHKNLLNPSERKHPRMYRALGVSWTRLRQALGKTSSKTLTRWCSNPHHTTGAKRDYPVIVHTNKRATKPNSLPKINDYPRLSHIIAHTLYRTQKCIEGFRGLQQLRNKLNLERERKRGGGHGSIGFASARPARERHKAANQQKTIYSTR